METIYVKNMVCDRCKMAVRSVFDSVGAVVLDVELGVVHIDSPLTSGERGVIRRELERQGFELLDDNRTRMVERIKTVVIDSLRYKCGETPENRNMSDVLAEKLHSDYSALSKLFSAETGTTIEKYVISQKVELVKELLSYGELSLTEIAVRLNYSSVAYLSAQFKNTTGMTPSEYKKKGVENRKCLDNV